jgi:hypothetical protein
LFARSLERSHQCLRGFVQTIRRQRAGGGGQLGGGEGVTRIEGGECQQRCVLPVVLTQSRS